MSISIVPIMCVLTVIVCTWIDAIGWKKAIKKIINSFGV